MDDCNPTGGLDCAQGHEVSYLQSLVLERCFIPRAGMAVAYQGVPEGRVSYKIDYTEAHRIST